MDSDEEFSFGNEDDYFPTSAPTAALAAGGRTRMTAAALTAAAAAADHLPFEGPYDTVKVRGQIQTTPAELQKAKRDDRLVFSTKNGAIEIGDMEYSNAEDATAEAHALGDVDIVKRVELNLETNDFLKGVQWYAEVPSVPASATERFARQEQTKSASAPYGTLVGQVTNGTHTLLDRVVTNLQVNYSGKYGGHTAESLANTVTFLPGDKGAYIQANSPVVAYYNAHARVLAGEVPALSAARPDHHGNLSADVRCARDALASAETARREHLAYGNVTDPSKFALILTPKEQKRYNGDADIHVATPVKITDIFERKLEAEPLYQRIKLAAAQDKLESIKNEAKERLISVNFSATIHYLKRRPAQ